MAAIASAPRLLSAGRSEWPANPKPSAGATHRVRGGPANSAVQRSPSLGVGSIPGGGRHSAGPAKLSRRQSSKPIAVAAIGGASVAVDGAPASALQADMLRAVEGLDFGITADEARAQAVEEAAVALERSGPPVNLAQNVGKVDGRWRLLFSSAFLSGSLGGKRPGPSATSSPVKFREVFQRIDVAKKEFDNIVALTLGPLGLLPALDLTATLGHTFELFGENGTRIVFDKTSVKGDGSLKNLPTLNIPQLPKFLRPPSSIRSGEFQTTYVDGNMRITRGDRGELRIFVRA